MKKLGIVSLFLCVVGMVSSVNAADLRQIDLDLFNAAHDGKTEVIEALLANGANINAIYPKTGATALIAAILSAKISAVKYLVESGANVTLGIATLPAGPEVIRKSAFQTAKHYATKYRLGKKIIFEEMADNLEKILKQKSTLHTLLAADKLAPSDDPEIPAFPPELIDRVLRPLVIASLEEDQQ